MKTKKEPLTYANVDNLMNRIAHDIEKATGLSVLYILKKQVVAVLAPRGNTVLETFFVFIEDGEVILDPNRVACRPWLAEIIDKSYKYWRNRV